MCAQHVELLSERHALDLHTRSLSFSPMLPVDSGSNLEGSSGVRNASAAPLPGRVAFIPCCAVCVPLTSRSLKIFVSSHRVLRPGLDGAVDEWFSGAPVFSEGVPQRPECDKFRALPALAS